MHGYRANKLTNTITTYIILFSFSTLYTLFEMQVWRFLSIKPARNVYEFWMCKHRVHVRIAFVFDSCALKHRHQRSIDRSSDSINPASGQRRSANWRIWSRKIETVYIGFSLLLHNTPKKWGAHQECTLRRYT